MGKLSPKNPTPPIDLNKVTRIVNALFPTHARVGERAIHVDETSIRLFTRYEATVAASKLKSGKTPGQHGILTEVMKKIAHKRSELLIDTYNACLMQRRFSEIWKTERLALIGKEKGGPDTPCAYRPRCMSDSAGKLLERLIKPKLEKAIEEKEGLSSRQHGFRPCRSTVGALGEVIHAFEADR